MRCDMLQAVGQTGHSKSQFVIHSYTHSFTHSLARSLVRSFVWLVYSCGCKMLITALMKWGYLFIWGGWPVVRVNPFAHLFILTNKFEASEGGSYGTAIELLDCFALLWLDSIWFGLVWLESVRSAISVGLFTELNVWPFHATLHTFVAHFVLHWAFLSSALKWSKGYGWATLQVPDITRQLPGIHLTLLIYLLYVFIFFLFAIACCCFCIINALPLAPQIIMAISKTLFSTTPTWTLWQHSPGMR